MSDYEWRLRLKYNPDQPRVPAGQSGGGQWTSSGGLSIPNGSYIKDVIPQMREYTLSTGQEVGAIFDSSGKLVSDIQVGGESSVLAISQPEYGRDLTSVHTHPQTKNISPPSRNDVNDFYQDSSLKESLILLPDGRVWSIQRGTGGESRLSGYDVRRIYRDVFDDLALADDAPDLFSDEWYRRGMSDVGRRLGLNITLEEI